MSATFLHKDSATLLGTWPFLEVINPILDQNALEPRATILSVSRETVLGYAVGGDALLIWVDADVAGRAITFPAGGPYTLDETIAFINADAGVTIAYRDNGFLRIESPTIGDASYLRIEVDQAALANYTALDTLGLFSETEAFGGQVASAKHIDPDRQVAFPGQSSMLLGEDFSATAFNRSVMQLAINSDISENLLSKKRVAARKEVQVTYATPPGDAGITVTGDVYTGSEPFATATHLTHENIFAVLDSLGNEFTKDFVNPQANATVAWSIHPDTGKQHAVSSGLFSGYTGADRVYLRPSGLSGGPAALNGKTLKIVEVLSTSEVVVDPIDPDTGIAHPFTDAANVSGLVIVETRRVLVDAVFTDSATTQRAEQWQESKVTATAVDRIDNGSRVYISGINLVSAGVLPGDDVTWAAYGSPNPYSNNGEYKVSRVVDPHTLEIVSSNWGPVHLNRDSTSGLGTVTIKTDGAFRTNPFLRFRSTAAGGAIPAPGDSLRIVYMGMSTIRAATDDPAVFAGYGVRYTQEADTSSQAALIKLAGPSMDSIQDILASDERLSVEDLHNRLNYEHYNYGSGEAGRHQDIRPDTIDMWNAVDGQSFTARATAADQISLDPKIGLHLEGSASPNHWWIDGVGNVHQEASGTSSVLMPAPTSVLGTEVLLGFGWTHGTVYYAVTAVDIDGNESPISAVIGPFTPDGVILDSVTITFDAVPGAVFYNIYEDDNVGMSSPDRVDVYLGGTPTSTGDIFGYDVIETGIRTPTSLPATIAHSSYIKSDGTTSWIAGPVSVNGAPDTHALTIRTRADGKGLSLHGGLTDAASTFPGEGSMRMEIDFVDGNSYPIHQTFSSYNDAVLDINGWRNKYRIEYDESKLIRYSSFNGFSWIPSIVFDVAAGAISIGTVGATPDIDTNFHINDSTRAIIRVERAGATTAFDIGLPSSGNDFVFETEGAATSSIKILGADGTVEIDTLDITGTVINTTKFEHDPGDSEPGGGAATVLFKTPTGPSTFGSWIEWQSSNGTVSGIVGTADLNDTADKFDLFVEARGVSTDLYLWGGRDVFVRSNVGGSSGNFKVLNNATAKLTVASNRVYAIDGFVAGSNSTTLGTNEKLHVAGLIKMAPQVLVSLPAGVDGQIISWQPSSGGDSQLYYYNGTTWKILTV